MSACGARSSSTALWAPSWMTRSTSTRGASSSPYPVTPGCPLTRGRPARLGWPARVGWPAKAGGAGTRVPRAPKREAGPWITLRPFGTPQPAARWLEALPVGNGRLGAMMHGRVHKEVIQLNEESLWTRPLGPRENPLALARLGEVRQALLAGRRPPGALPRRAGLVRGPRSQAAYQTLGHLTLLNFGHHEEWANDYRRSLDLRDGVARLVYRLGEVEHRRELFASAPDQVIAVRLESTPAWPSRSAWSCGAGLTAGARPSVATSSSSGAAAGPTAPASWPGAASSPTAAKRRRRG